TAVARGQARVRVAVEPALVVGRYVERRLRDSERAVVEDKGVVTGAQRSERSRDRIAADVRRLIRCRREGRLPGDAGIGEALTEPEAGVARSEARVGAAVEPALRVRGDVERSLADRKRALDEREVVIREPGGCRVDGSRGDRVAAHVAALGRGCRVRRAYAVA